MSVLIALALASSTTSAAMTPWARCTTAYALPRLQSQATETIVDHAMAACSKEERAALKEWTDDYGQAQGAEIFRGVRFKVRQVLVRRINEAKRMRGYR